MSSMQVNEAANHYPAFDPHNLHGCPRASVEFANVIHMMSTIHVIDSTWRFACSIMLSWDRVAL